MEKRMVIAIALSLLILVIFQGLNPARRARLKTQQIVPSEQTKEKPFSSGGAKDTAYPAGAKEATEEVSLQEKTLEVNTDKYRLTFSDIGGSLKKISLNEYEKEGSEEILFEEKNPSDYLFAMQSGVLTGLDRKKFSSTKGTGYVEYRLTDPGWVEVTKEYTIHNSLDYIQLDVFIKNISSRKIVFSYWMKGPSRIKKSAPVVGRSFLEADTMVDGQIWKARSAKGIQERTGNISWTALKNRYFTMILKPITPPKSVALRQIMDGNLSIALNSQGYELRPGGSIKQKYLLYAGPLNEGRIAAIGQDMQGVVDYGFFGGVSKALLSILRFFHKGTKNWGLAILCLTILMNIILFPLTMKSFHSMQQMKKVQPHIQKLKELHKDNPQKLNKEMMELYKKYNVNPLGGCLPLLLQMPIFIALYQGLMRSIELKGARFLWIKDLAKPDAVPLPFSLPVIGNHINILPLLMVGAMLMQQKISQGFSAGAVTAEQATQQKMMMLMMPLLFGFIFYKMPAGLVLYWLTNTILMTSEQSLMSRRMSGS